MKKNISVTPSSKLREEGRSSKQRGTRNQSHVINSSLQAVPSGSARIITETGDGVSGRYGLDLLL